MDISRIDEQAVEDELRELGVHIHGHVPCEFCGEQLLRWPSIVEQEKFPPAQVGIYISNKILFLSFSLYLSYSVVQNTVNLLKLFSKCRDKKMKDSIQNKSTSNLTAKFVVDVLDN
jgi:hypothetical protein